MDIGNAPIDLRLRCAPSCVPTGESQSRLHSLTSLEERGEAMAHVSFTGFCPVFVVFLFVNCIAGSVFLMFFQVVVWSLLWGLVRLVRAAGCLDLVGCIEEQLEISFGQLRQRLSEVSWRFQVV